MKKIKSKLFEEFKIENNKIVKVIGGISATTTPSNDTIVQGGSYDLAFETCIYGETEDISSVNTGTTDLDKPLLKLY